MKIVLIRNLLSRNGSQRACQQTCAQLRTYGHNVEIQDTEYAGHAEVLAREAGDRADTVVAAGGDGTFHQVANGLAGKTTPMGVLPLGTANMLGYEIGIGTDVHKAVCTILHGNVQTVSLGKYTSGYFLLVAGVGFDAETVNNLNPRLKALTGKTAFVASGIYVLTRRLQHFRFGVKLDGGQEISAQSVIIHNACHYGGRFRVAPDTRLDKPELGVSVFPPATARKTAQNIIRFMRGYHGSSEDGRYFKAQRVSVYAQDSAMQEQPVQMDGEITTTLPLQAAIASEKLNLLVPVKE